MSVEIDINTNNQNFNYAQAFSRNLGWISPEELNILSTKKLAFPGLGGVGGHHINNFARLGIQNFHIADFDHYSQENFNRQLGANCQTIGRLKTDVMEEYILGVNPRSQIKIFPDGVTFDNAEEFLSGVDLIIDTLDLYAMDIRIHLYDLANKMKIPMVSAGPFGMGTSVMAFHPDQASFSEFFCLNEKGLSTQQQIIRFVAGMTPIKMLLDSYLVYEDGLDGKNGRLPSLNLGCDAAAAALGSMALKILLDRPNILWSPKGFYADFYLYKSKVFHLPRGNRSLFQKWKIRQLEKNMGI